MGIARVVGLAGVVFSAGCASTSQYVESDFVRTPIQGYGTVGEKLVSERSGRAFEVYGVCADGGQQFFIKDAMTSLPGSGGRWITRYQDGHSYPSSNDFSSSKVFLDALASLEVVKPAEAFSGELRMRVADQRALKIPEECKAIQQREQSIASIHAKANSEKNVSMVREVVDRTGVRPMFKGRNEQDFNNLVNMFKRLGIEDFAGKFVWAEDGDYIVSQILDGEVVLTSMTNPALFPTISIRTKKQALEGQRWSTVSRGPLQFIGPKLYRTVLGVQRQLLVFKTI